MHSAVADRLRSAGLELPALVAPVGDYVPATLAGPLVFTSGQLPVVDGALMSSGSVGGSVPVDVAAACARQAALNALAAAASVCDLDAVARVAKLVCFVASEESFQAHPAVANGASGVMVAAFGDVAGRHAREAVGVASLPMGAPVEVSIILHLG